MTKKSKTADPGTNQAAATTAVTDQVQPQCTISDAIGQAPQESLDYLDVAYTAFLAVLNDIETGLDDELAADLQSFVRVRNANLTQNENAALDSLMADEIARRPPGVQRQATSILELDGNHDLLEAVCEAVGVLPYGATWQDMESLVGSIAWEWESWLPRGALTLVAGEPGQGKSVLVLRMAATYLRGDPWPNGAPFDSETGAVLWCEAEAAQALNLDRAKTWGLPLERIYTPFDNPLEDVQLDKTEHQEAVEKVATRPDVRLVIVDSLRGAHRRDENSSVTMEVVKWLAELSRNLCKPVLLTHHLRKRGILDVGDRVTLDRIRGSSAIIQTARMVWAIDAPDLDYEDNKRLSVIKSNLARFPEPIGFTIGDEMRLAFGDAPEAPRQESQLDKAIDLLRALLASGPVASVDLEEEAQGAGLSWDTMKRAKAKLGVVAKRDGKSRRWTWALPAKDIVH